MVCMRLTTMQQSGPSSLIAKFSAQKPFPLEYAELPKNKVQRHINMALSRFGLNRFSNKIPAELTGASPAILARTLLLEIIGEAEAIGQLR